jgi:hypothetical protein
VITTIRGTDSQDACCYTARFTFVDLRSSSNGTPTDGIAEFRYWEKGWHLQNFRWGDPPGVSMVWIESDLPKSQQEGAR